MPKRKSPFWESIKEFSKRMGAVAAIIMALGVISSGLYWTLNYYTTTKIHNADIEYIENEVEVLYNQIANHTH